MNLLLLFVAAFPLNTTFTATMDVNNATPEETAPTVSFVVDMQEIELPPGVLITSGTDEKVFQYTVPPITACESGWAFFVATRNGKNLEILNGQIVRAATPHSTWTPASTPAPAPTETPRISTATPASTPTRMKRRVPPGAHNLGEVEAVRFWRNGDKCAVDLTIDGKPQTWYGGTR